MNANLKLFVFAGKNVKEKAAIRYLNEILNLYFLNAKIMQNEEGIKLLSIEIITKPIFMHLLNYDENTAENALIPPEVE